MIIDKEIEILVNNQNLEHYKNKGYDAIYREKLKVKVLDLTIGSHYKVNVKCDLCDSINIVEFRQLKGSEDYLCNSCAAKNKKRVSLTDDKKKDMIRKMLKTREINKSKDPNYGKSKSENNSKKDKKITKKERVKKSQEEIKLIIKKRKETKLKKYGDENYNNQEKKRITLKEKYGDENYNNNKARKETLKKKYGDENFNNQIKKEETCLDKYGVRHTNQNIETMIKIQKSAFKIKLHEDTNLYYRGTYEKHFLDYCYLNNIEITEFKDGIYYEYDGKIHRYYPDFYHPESKTIIEVKSKYTFDSEYDINMLKRESASKNHNFLFIIDKDYSDFISYITS